MSKTLPYADMSATTLVALKELAAKPLASATAMPKDMYVSPSIFQLEIERLFWYKTSSFLPMGSILVGSEWRA